MHMFRRTSKKHGYMYKHCIYTFWSLLILSTKTKYNVITNKLITLSPNAGVYLIIAKKSCIKILRCNKIIIYLYTGNQILVYDAV